MKMDSRNNTKPPGVEKVYVKDLKPQMNNFNIKVIVLKQDLHIPPKDAKSPGVSHWRVADHTASITLVTFCEKGQLLQPGDIVHIQQCYTDVHRDSLNLYYNKNRGNIVKFNEFMMVANYDLDMSKKSEEMAKLCVEKDKMKMMRQSSGSKF